ncbi:MAG TPA: phospholipase D-like domain-containing protein [Vicinamibacterales bacterium]|jgi:cardiolipin synthase|nr:phospholipase D-like domain-containing protein [Vicinamibacterales bacterium]
MDWWQLVGLAFIAWFVLVLLFTPRIDYQVTVPLRPDSDDFIYVLQSACQGAIHLHNRVDIFTNGAQFYPAMRDAILSAQLSVNLEAYIFQPGEAADMIVEAMIERAKAGVEVRVVLDAIGSSYLRNRAAARLAAHGCRVAFYQPITWYRLHRLNNRTHRELMVIDGKMAFTGGAGVADWWYKPVHGPAWRDTMARIEGPVAAAIQGTFAENWLEACGEILTGPRHWPAIEPAGKAGAMLVKSSPSDRATVSRVVFQMLMEGAVTSIDISTPYFLPDKAFRRALVRAAQRGVQVRVIVPGLHTDQRWVRFASRRMYRELLAAGVRMFEYRPAMIHVKTVMVDGVWAMIGTTNIDNRSFEHNDEVNVAFREHGVTARFRHDFEADLAASDEVTLDRWIARPVFEKVIGPVCWILERQQ